MGGGGDVDAAFRWFITKAGGGDLVILRTSGSNAYHDYLFTKLGGVDSVETLVFHDRRAASDPRVLAIIARADGIFLAGGDQSRYVNFWQDTPVAAALNAHVRAGKPLGGTSAGLAVLGEFAFAALEPGDLTSAIALPNPYDFRITLTRNFLELDLLRGVLTDSHFMPRQRLGRSLVFLARLMAEHNPPHLIGLGVDEKTALCVDPDGTARVFTAGSGQVWLLVPTQAATVLAPRKPLSLPNVKVIGLGPASAFNLRTLEVAQPASFATVSVLAGRLVPAE
jgi:cyanophycinase